jgi:hypothetical protein
MSPLKIGQSQAKIRRLPGVSVDSVGGGLLALSMQCAARIQRPYHLGFHRSFAKCLRNDAQISSKRFSSGLAVARGCGFNMS